MRRQLRKNAYVVIMVALLLGNRRLGRIITAIILESFGASALGASVPTRMSSQRVVPGH